MNIDELLKSKNISYIPSGRDYLVRCLNPAHEDRNPSMRIDKILGVYNCLSCGFSGNIYKLFDETPPSILHIKREKLKKLISTKLTDVDGLTIPIESIPFTDPWRGISGGTFKHFEAFQHHDPQFVGRIVFPIRSISNKLIGFVGRHTGDVTPKYRLHPQGIKLPLYPIAKPINGSVILVEGIMDMLNLYDKGLHNSVCLFGVNSLTEEKLNLLKVSGVSNIDLCLDNDPAGKKATQDYLKLIDKCELTARIIDLKNKKDPGELTAEEVIQIKEKYYG